MWADLVHLRDCSSSTVLKPAQALEKGSIWSQQFIWNPTGQWQSPPCCDAAPGGADHPFLQPQWCSQPSFCPAPWPDTAWCLSTEPRAFSPKGLQFSSPLHIPHISTCVKGKQLCCIFSFTSWKEKQRKLKSEVLFGTTERINDAFPSSSTFPPKLTC